MRSLGILAMLVLSAGSFAQNDAVTYERLYQEASASASAKPEEAAQKYAAALKMFDYDGDIWREYARVLMRLKRNDEAISALRKALEFGTFENKASAEIHYDIARCHARDKRLDQAMEELKLAMALGLRNIEAVRQQGDFAELKFRKEWEELAATKDVSKMTRDEGWRYDLWFLDREVRRIHYNPNRKFSNKEHDAWVKDLGRRIPKMTDGQIRVAFIKYMVRMGDGHTGIRLFPSDKQPPLLGFQSFWFKDGLHIVATAPNNRGFLGAKILKVCGKTLEELKPLIAEISPADNATAVMTRTPAILVSPTALHGLGLMPERQEVEFEVQDMAGLTKNVTIKADASGPTDNWIRLQNTVPGEVPLYLKDRGKAYWFTEVPAMEAIYCQYNSVSADPTESPQKFAERLFSAMESPSIKRLILDVRWNGGGNSFLNRWLVNGTIACKKAQESHGLFLITGRNTFSAAQNFSTDIARHCTPILVGEPTGSSPNFVGETIRVVLPYSKMEGSISDLYWQRSWPMDHRTWLPPDLPAFPSFELAKQNRDPAMEAIQAFLESKKD